MAVLLTRVLCSHSVQCDLASRERHRADAGTRQSRPGSHDQGTRLQGLPHTTRGDPEHTDW